MFKRSVCMSTGTDDNDGLAAAKCHVRELRPLHHLQRTQNLAQNSTKQVGTQHHDPGGFARQI